MDVQKSNLLSPQLLLLETMWVAGVSCPSGHIRLTLLAFLLHTRLLLDKPLVDQQVLVVVLVGLLQQSVEEGESEMATGPTLLRLEAPLLTPKHSAPKPGPGIEFQAALVKTA